LITPTSAPTVDILLVEDSPGDVRLTREALRDSRIATRLHVTGDGEEALAFLRREGVHKHAPTPSLVLLDLNLPRLDGRDLLRIMKSDPDLTRIPVVVLTTSVAEADVRSVYDVGGNCYVTKPLDYDGFVDVMRRIEEFWLTIVRLPSAVTR
jgi:two-component system, chemotaxis family, response regulator Rcp1